MMGLVFLSGQLQKRISPLEQQLADLRWYQNTLLPIARLPSEILIKVFGFVWSVNRRDDETNILGAILTRICREWARLIDDTPSLWAPISPYKSTVKHVIMALEKSQSLPVDLYFDEDYMKHMPLDHFYGAIKRHAARWKVLDVKVMLLARHRDINLSTVQSVYPSTEKTPGLWPNVCHQTL